MRVVTTCPKSGLDEYAHRWLDGRKNWPLETEFVFYRENFDVDCPGKDFRDMPEFSQWKLKHAAYVAPSWPWDVVKFAHKAFAAIDALYDYDGIGVWLDADCVTHQAIPEGLIEKQVEGVYLAHYARTGLFTETGLWIVDCRHPMHRQFMDAVRKWYLDDEFKKFPQWHDCIGLDTAIRGLDPPRKNLSGEMHKHSHPLSVTELGRYIDHCKGQRKIAGHSPENKFHQVAA